MRDHDPPMSRLSTPLTSLAPCCGRRPLGAVWAWPCKWCCSSTGRPAWPIWDGFVFPPPSRPWTSIPPWNRQAMSCCSCWPAKSIPITKSGSDAGPSDCSRTRWRNLLLNRAKNAPTPPRLRSWKNPWVTSSTMWSACSTGPSGPKVSGVWSRPDARQHRSPLQAVGHVMGRAGGRKYSGLALHPLQPSPR